MQPNRDRPRPQFETSLIDQTMIEKAMEELNERIQASGCGLLDREPALHEFLETRVLQLAGWLLMNNTAAGTIRGVAVGVYYLLDVTAHVVAMAHRGLWDDFLPEAKPRTKCAGQNSGKEGEPSGSEQEPGPAGDGPDIKEGR